MNMLRQPIVCVLGHVDHGKTTLADKIRSTAVATKEAGGITQAIGATEIPIDTIKKICGPLLERMKIKLDIPGLLLIDTPGHEAFTSLRKRGGSSADIAILVVDINEGFQPQTDESLLLLKQFKTPFVVAATKIDKIQNWVAYAGTFSESFEKQPSLARESLDNALYKIVGQLSERGFDSERFDRVNDFKKTVAIVPCSGITGEGVAELLMLLSGMAQSFLKQELELKSKNGMGSVLEVKELRGHGTTIDVILYDGEIHRGDWLVIGGKQPIVTKIKALLKPKPLRELRVEKQFESVSSITAASGIKISAPELEKAVGGSPFIAVRKESEIEKAKKELMSEEAVEFEKAGAGVILKADTLGSLEALIHILKQKNIEIKKAEVGAVKRSDVIAAEQSPPLKKLIFAFNVAVGNDAAEEAKNKVKILQSNIIYKLIEDYDLWLRQEQERLKQEKLEAITMPARIVLLKGFVFRQSKPAVVGVEVLEGVIKPRVNLLKDGKVVGTVKEIQSEGATVEKAEKGQRAALSIEGPTVGRQIEEGDELFVAVNENDLKVLEEFGSAEEIALAKKILGIE